MDAPSPLTELTRSAAWTRHRARVPRYLALALLGVLLFLGVRSVIAPPAATSVGQPRVPRADDPSRYLALGFARAYLSYDAAHPEQRERALAPYIGESGEALAGLTPRRGSQRILWEDIASDQRSLQGGRTITVAAAVSGSELPLYLAICVEHPRGEPARIIGNPAIVGAPSIDPAGASESGEAVENPMLLEVVDRVLRNFLAGSGRDLEADLTPEAAVTLPTRSMRLVEVSEVAWIGDPGSGAVLATVEAGEPNGASYVLSYELGISYRDRPYVDFIEVVPTDT
jgi:hypothetical protein